MNEHFSGKKERQLENTSRINVLKNLGYAAAIALILSSCKYKKWNPLQDLRDKLPKLEKVKQDTIYFKVEMLNVKAKTEPVIEKYVGTMESFRASGRIRNEFETVEGKAVFDLVKPLKWNSHLAHQATNDNSLIYRYTEIEKN